MKRFFALTVVLTAVIGLTLSFAGPERYEAKSMPQPVVQEELCNWTGFYIGLHAGWAEGPLNWIDSDNPAEAPETLVVQTASGFLGGAQVGYNYQWHWLVVGAEGEFSYADVNADNIVKFVDHFHARNDWTGTIAGRAGIAWNKWLFYGKGGGAFAHAKYNLDHNADSFKADGTQFSPLVGAGIEYMINCHWSAKVEYQHAFFGSEAIDGINIEDEIGTTNTGPSIEKETYDIEKPQNSVRVGLNYKF